MGYCSWGRKESGTTECAHTHTSAQSHNRASNMILLFQITLSDQIKKSILNGFDSFNDDFCFFSALTSLFLHSSL